MKIPSTNELVNGMGLDEQYVIEHFAGKSEKDVYEMLKERKSSLYTEDFTYMSQVALEYYLAPVIDYVQSPDSNFDFDFAVGILTSLSLQHEQNKLSKSIIEKILFVANYIKDNMTKFGIEENDSYFLEKINEIKNSQEKNQSFERIKKIKFLI